jgi:transcriptional activator protein UGA3
MYRIASLIRKKRERASLSARKGNSWNYDELVDLVSEAEKIQQDLDTEKRLIDEVIESGWTHRLMSMITALTNAFHLEHPRLEAHRCLHEVFRLTCVLQLRCQVLNEPSTSLPIRLLIRQLLGLLESMMKQNLPGWCSCHWVQFQTALYCLDIKCENEQSDRDRINVLYDRTL